MGKALLIEGHPIGCGPILGTTIARISKLKPASCGFNRTCSVSRTLSPVTVLTVQVIGPNFSCGIPFLRKEAVTKLQVDCVSSRIKA